MQSKTNRIKIINDVYHKAGIRMFELPVARLTQLLNKFEMNNE